MKVSIVTCSLNQGNFIDETIQSVLKQKGNFELEYIIIDGGSTDNTIDIIKKYDTLINSSDFSPECKKLSFKWVSEKDKGHSNAVNKGLKQCTGEVINWLCSDDILEANALQEVVKFFQSNKDSSAVFGDGLHIDEKGAIQKYIRSKDFKRKDVIVCHWSIKMPWLVQPSIFFRKKVLEEIGYLDENNNLCPDYDFYLRISKKYTLKALHKPLSRIRLHGACNSVKYRIKQRADAVKIAKKCWKENYLYYAPHYLLNEPFRKVLETLIAFSFKCRQKSEVCRKLIQSEAYKKLARLITGQ